jgi:hypothetical protein
MGESGAIGVVMTKDGTEIYYKGGGDLLAFQRG